jgi:hypothetical protein
MFLSEAASELSNSNREGVGHLLPCDPCGPLKGTGLQSLAIKLGHTVTLDTSSSNS